MVLDDWIKQKANGTLLTKKVHPITSSTFNYLLNFAKDPLVVILCITCVIGWRYRAKLYPPIRKLQTWMSSVICPPQKNELCIFALNTKTLRKVEQLMKNLLSETDLKANGIVITTHHVKTREIKKEPTVKLAMCCGNNSERLILRSTDEPDEMSAMLEWTEQKKVPTVIIIDGLQCEEGSLYDHEAITERLLRSQPNLQSYIGTDRFFTIGNSFNHCQKQAMLSWFYNAC